MPENSDRYKILKKLGGGGMGEVYLAEDLLLDRKVVLKFLTKASRHDPAARKRLLREAKAAAAIDHPYICKIYEAGETGGDIFIAMEYIEGQDLYERLRKGRLPIDEALRIGFEIIDGLARAHAGRVVHRDLKPSNVMLTPDSHVKIVDFGLARVVPTGNSSTLSGPNLTASGAMIGTMTYMSPEQIQGEKADERSDVFTLGIIFFEMLAGRHPFLRKTYVETATAILREDAPPLSQFIEGCPEGLEETVAKMLSKAPSERYASAGEVGRALRARGSGVRSGAITPRPRTGPGLLPSIAVLSFVNRSRDEEFDYFVEGMTDELNARISKIPGLKVISRTSAMRFKDSEKSLPEIGRELGAGFLLEGSVQHFSSRVRIITGLVEVEEGSQVWAETYDREMQDIFAIQTDVSQNIAHAIRARFSGVGLTAFSGGAEQPRSISTYHLYLRGIYYMNKWSPAAAKQAIEFFEKAIESDPNYSPSHAGLATCYGKAAMIGFLRGKEAIEAAPKARAAAERALELNPNLPEAHVGKGVVALAFDWDFRTAESSLERALELNPNHADAQTLLGWPLAFQCRFDEARSYAERAVELNPLDPTALTHLAWVILFGGGPEDSVEQKLQQALEIDPNFPMAKNTLSALYMLRGETEKGLELARQGGTWERATLGVSYAMTGNREEAQKILEEITRPDQAGRHSPFDIARLYLALGDVDRGFEMLEKAYEGHDNHLLFVEPVFRYWPLLRPHRENPRYIEILHKMGLA
ncbi:MAG: protein kinase [Acidobacteriota bacterium]|nr:protein kinase [Acidobacteriota bacterium]